ncbi:MAG: DNA mismatch repair endonuclease MutL [Dehalococcoidales bacterium]|nr:DNA mismatch repair endonuclease MutL [Dehalococcoidales bacterium]
MTIQVLKNEVINKIAAGEVVERASSVVKELVENSLDAGATQITVEINGGGLALIRVTDNGSGILSDEIQLAFERHATSKINSFEDLSLNHSLGFRGEALPSIASVSDVEIISSNVNENSGTYAELENGLVVKKQKQARSQGTTIAVKNLFRNVPARLKFIKSKTTENSHIANVVSQYALAYPEVRFSLFIDGRESLKTPGTGNLIDSINAVYGVEIASNMMPINSSQDFNTDEKGVVISGMVASPKISRSNRNYISLFVNRRWVANRNLVWAVEEAYHGLLMTGKHPVAVINIEVPLSDVDANVHPTKTEVRFKEEGNIYLALQRAVRQSLVNTAPVPRVGEITASYRGQSQLIVPPEQRRMEMKVVNEEEPGTPVVSSLPVLRLLGQSMNSYIVAEGPDGIYIIDQHAAHERIMFEKITKQKEQQGVEVQGLLEPVSIEVLPVQDEILFKNYKYLADFGFTIEPFGNRNYLVRTVPSIMYKKDWQSALNELIDKLSIKNKANITEHIISTIACHSAVRFGQSLSHDEMRELVRQMEQADLPHACPHGRTTMIHITKKQLEKEFGRI